MPFPHEVFKVQRIVPTRFVRATTGQPLLNFPDVDDRGYFRTGVTAGNDHGHVVGVGQGDLVFVKVQRAAIENTAPLFATSSNTSTMTVGAIGSGAAALPSTQEIILQVTGVAGGGGVAPNTAKLQIHHGSVTGPIIGELSVWVFTKLNVGITPHVVTINGSGGGSVASAVNLTAVMNVVRAIWQPCGITITVSPVVNDTVTFATAGDAVWQAEINTLLSTNFAAGTINAYFVNRIVIAGSPGVLGLGLSRPNSVAFGTPNPGIILGDTNVSGASRAADAHWLGNDLAHEVGHFFTLDHPDRLSPPAANPRFDTWTVRMLMHNFNQRDARTDWRNDVGYGPQFRGALVTMKDLVDSANAAHHSTDGECTIARTAINTPPGPF